MKTLMILAAAVLLSAPAVKADATGTAQFRVLSNGIFGFAYDAAPGQVSGEYWNNGTETVNLSRDESGAWRGSYGLFQIKAGPMKASSNGKRETVEVRVLPGGFYEFTLSTNKKGGLQINTFTANGRLQTASLNASGTEFSATGTRFQVGLSSNGRPGSYEGSVLYNRSGFSDEATMSASGSLDLASLAKADPVLFVVLYVLPFQLENDWQIMR